MKFVNEGQMINNIKYMRTMVTAKCFNNGSTGRKLLAKNQLKEYQKIVYDVVAAEKNLNYEVGIQFLFNYRVLFLPHISQKSLFVF